MFSNKRPFIEYSVYISVCPEYCLISTNLNEIIGQYYDDYDEVAVKWYNDIKKYPDDPENKVTPALFARINAHAARSIALEKHKQNAIENSIALFKVIHRYLENGNLSTFGSVTISREPVSIVIDNLNLTTKEALGESEFYSYLNDLFREMLKENVVSDELLESSKLPFYVKSILQLRT
jgi:hypothetical protein